MTKALAERVNDLCAFLYAGPSPLHAAMELERRLRAAGFQALSLTDPHWQVARGGWYVRQGAAVVAFRLRSTTPQRFALIGAHTDSPHLRLKPRAAFACEGCLQLGVEVYGGALVNSWLDRDLGLAGTVFAANGSAIPVLLRQPLARVPQLAIHLDRQINEHGLKLNPQTHLAPVWGLAADGPQSADDAFADVLANAAGIPVDQVVGHDLSLFDLIPAQVGGIKGEFLYSARLDNLASVHAGLHALIDASDGAAATVPVLACFDHEEVGNGSRDGADSPLLGQVLERLYLALRLERTAFLAACAGSLMISADMAHGVHPNYADRHEPRHKPRLGAGPVLKSNHNQRYATSGATAATVRLLAKRAAVPLQDFVARSDLGCGSTIGPAVATRLGCAVADVGTPMWSMHSIRECAGTADHEPYISLLTAHLRS